IRPSATGARSSPTPPCLPPPPWIGCYTAPPSSTSAATVPASRKNAKLGNRAALGSRKGVPSERLTHVIVADQRHAPSPTPPPHAPLCPAVPRVGQPLLLLGGSFSGDS